eukprot:360838-Chlamydomonas_euryale.AAC.4
MLVLAWHPTQRAASVGLPDDGRQALALPAQVLYAPLFHAVALGMMFGGRALFGGCDCPTHHDDGDSCAATHSNSA